MISRIRGELLHRDLDSVEVLTPGGIVYEVEVPLTVFQRLPREGSQIELRTVHVVKEDSANLYGFMEAHERALFSRLLGASGVGPKLALAMMSTYTAPRLARALSERDVRALVEVSGVGKKKAERIILELADRVQDLAIAVASEPKGADHGAQAAVLALTTLGYSYVDADQAVREAIDDGAESKTEELIRTVLARRAPTPTEAAG